MADPTVFVTRLSGNDDVPSVALEHGQDFAGGTSLVWTAAGYNGDSHPATGVNIGGVDAELITGSPDNVGGSYLQQWLALAVPGGRRDITITFGSSNANYWEGALQEIAGALELIALNRAIDNSGSGDKSIVSADVGAESPEVGDLVIAAEAGGAGAASIEAGWTELFNSAVDGSGMSGQGIYQEAAGAGNQTALFHNGNTANTEKLIAVYRVSAAGPSFNAALARNANQVMQ